MLDNGSAAVRCNRVYVGEAVTSASAVTPVTSYASRCQFDSGWTATLSGIGTTTVTHDLGVQPARRVVIAEGTTVDASYAVCGQISTEGGLDSTSASAPTPMGLATTRNTPSIRTNTGAAWAANNKPTAA